MPRLRWTDEMIERLFHMRDELKMKFDDIGAVFGMRGSGCCSKYNKVASWRRVEFLRNRSLALRTDMVESGWTPCDPPVPGAPRPRYFHDADADIRARIARQGITAGVFGDPPPGRSALDQRGRP